MKEAAASNTSPSNTIIPMRVLKIASCPTNSAKANLIYHIGCNEEHDLYFRITANTGGGLFSPEWVSLNVMLSILEASPQPIISYPLLPKLIGKSVNTPAFLMAALKIEGLVRSLEGKIRGYEISDSQAFMTEMKALIASDVNLKVTDIPSNYKTSSGLKPKKATKPDSSIQAKKAEKALKTLLANQ
jgi:hypothetical protein